VTTRQRHHPFLAWHHPSPVNRICDLLVSSPLLSTNSNLYRYAEDGGKWATLCFFGGICITYMLDALVGGCTS
jgi:hypothetical protein